MNFIVIYGAPRRLNDRLRFQRRDVTTLDIVEGLAFEHMNANNLTTFTIHECDSAGYIKGKCLSTEAGRIVA